MAKKKFYGGDYAGIDARRAMENRDANMIPSDRGIANMPQTLVMRQYPNTVYNGFEGLNDTIRGIDKQMKDDVKMKKSSKFPEKY
jgi:hypothetical protein